MTFKIHYPFCLLLLASVSVAQPHYPQNFAGSTYNAETQTVERVPRPPALSLKELKGDEDSDKDAVGEAKNTPVLVIPTEGVGSMTQVEGDGVEVIKIGGYIDARDNKHFEANIKELRELAAKYDLAIGEVYGVGNYGWFFNKPEIVFTILARNGKPRIAHSVPKELSINSSPAWLVATKHGTIVLEGVGALEDLFNAEGKLVLSRLTVTTKEPLSAQPTAASTAAIPPQK